MINIKTIILVTTLLLTPIVHAGGLFGVDLDKTLNPDLIVQSNDLYVLNLTPDLIGYKINPPNPSLNFKDYYVGMKDNKIKQITAIGYADVGAIDSDKLESGEPNENLSKQLIVYQVVKDDLSTRLGELVENNSKYVYFPSSTLIKDNTEISLKTSLSAKDDKDIEHFYNIRIDYKTN